MTLGRWSLCLSFLIWKRRQYVACALRTLRLAELAQGPPPGEHRPSSWW